jgi:hypothetical protein
MILNNYFRNNLILVAMMLQKIMSALVHKTLFYAWDYNTCCARVYKLPPYKKNVRNIFISW